MLPQRYVPKKISDVKENDSRIAVIGKIISAMENRFVIEDSSGRAEIFSEHSIESGNFVRIFCSIVDGKLKADAVQSLNGFDLNLYQKVESLYRRAGL